MQSTPDNTCACQDCPDWKESASKHRDCRRQTSRLEGIRASCADRNSNFAIPSCGWRVYTYSWNFFLPLAAKPTKWAISCQDHPMLTQETKHGVQSAQRGDKQQPVLNIIHRLSWWDPQPVQKQRHVDQARRTNSVRFHRLKVMPTQPISQKCKKSLQQEAISKINDSGGWICWQARRPITFDSLIRSGYLTFLLLVTQPVWPSVTWILSI